MPGLDDKLTGVDRLELESPRSPGLDAFRAADGPGLLVPTESGGLGATAREAVAVQYAVGSRSGSLAVGTTMHHFSMASLIALGPIFPTTLKSMRFAPQGIPRITEWKKRIGNIPLVAIGGIKFEQSAGIFAAGADSIAVVSDVTQNADPDARVKQWLGHPAKAA